MSEGEGRGALERRLQDSLDRVDQELARACIPLHELQERAAVELAKIGVFDPDDDARDHYTLLQLLSWFKASFRWVNAPPCDFCASETRMVGMGVPSEEELRFGAGRVEIYSCQLCGTCTRFPRYNDPMKLMETRCGRCGEWANCFTFYCISLGYEARLVLDFEDHVWTECYSKYLGRWMHLDPCEASFDKPLLYEEGWGKKLSYVFAISRDGIYDVTKRYTRKWPEVLSRRTIVKETEVEDTVAFLTAMKRSLLEAEEFELLEQRDELELKEILESQSAGPLKEELPGRLSGSVEWRTARGEIGTQKTSSHQSFCSPRLCLDDYVQEVYGAIGSLCSQPGAAEAMASLHKILLRLRNEPYETRSVRLLVEEVELCRKHEAFFSSLGLKHTVREGGETYLCLEASPGKAALRLTLIIELFENIAKTYYSAEGLELMIEGTRICGGTVYATGEELPSGTANAAFDGFNSTKWEEPQGSKGACMVYHLREGSLGKILGYDLVSANDCPERDPKDWVLEGSSDNGQTWNVLDRKAGHLFNKRFERCSFRLTAEAQLQCGILRLVFTAVRDPSATSRLQLSCIDFYCSVAK